jgi:hypothetical protein
MRRRFSPFLPRAFPKKHSRTITKSARTLKYFAQQTHHLT